MKPRHTETRRTCLVYSPGGHYTELKKATAGIDFTDCYHVTFALDGAGAQYDTVPERYFVTHPRRNPLRLVRNIWQSCRLLRTHRPQLIISTGADVTVATIILGKLIFGAQVIFIESAGDITPTLTGRLVYRFCDLFIIPWPEKQRAFPKAVLAEGLLL